MYIVQLHCTTGEFKRGANPKKLLMGFWGFTMSRSYIINKKLKKKLAESGHRVALSKFPKIVSLEWLLSINRPNINIFPKFQKHFVCYDLLDLNIKFGEDWPRTVAFIAWKPLFRVVEICRYLKTPYFSDFFFKIISVVFGGSPLIFFRTAKQHVWAH